MHRQDCHQLLLVAFAYLPGNLLVLADGRVGFIDFGIVGKISPATWGAMQALMLAVSTEDYDTMARALLTMGATIETVDIQVHCLHPLICLNRCTTVGRRCCGIV